MKILIVEDHDVTRKRLVSLLQGHDGYTVTAAVDCAERALELIVDQPPEIVILDLGLPGMSGVTAIKAIKKLAPAVEILVFTVMEEDEQVFAALKAGAAGYILKDAQLLQIVAALEEFRSGGSPMSFPIARKVLREFQNLPAKQELQEVVSPLSRRETEILELLYQGDHFKGIAGKLCISTHTVHAHIKNIYSKLHVNSRAQAIFEACNQNLIRR